MHYDVTALGEILIDYTPCGQNEQGYPLYIQNPGGAPVNLSAAVAAFGGHSAFLGKVGEDAQGHFLRTCLARAGVDVQGLCSDPVRHTTLAFVSLLEGGERAFTFYRDHEADAHLRAEEVRFDLIEHSRIFHFGSLSLTHPDAREATWAAVHRAKEAGCLLSFDPNYRAAIWPEAEALPHMRAGLAEADLVKLSLEEAELLCGKMGAEDCAKQIHALGARLVAVTLGREGAWISGEGYAFLCPAYTAGQTVDTTGAGDIFWGSFLLRLSREGLRLDDEDGARRAAAFACTAAGLSTGVRGGLPSIPREEDVLSALAGPEAPFAQK